MAWRLRGTCIEFCSCDPGCGCNFRGFPTSDEGNCEAFVGHHIEDGRFDDVDLSRTKVAWALWWPGPIHDGGGRGHAYVDCAADEQWEALARIYRGEAGYPLFEIFNSTFVAPTIVERAAFDMMIEGKSSRVWVEGVGGATMEPLRNPVTGAENHVRIVKRDGFIWKDGEIARGAKLRVDLPEMRFEHTGRHAVIAPFDWSA